MRTNPVAVALLSGGMDSTTLVYYLKKQGYDVVCLSVHYGQKHKKELEYAMATTRRLGIEHKLIDFAGFATLLGPSAGSLTGTTAVPEGHYAAENMAQTVVPNRNAILLAAAYALATVREAKLVATAVHSGDHAIYPDCRPEFVEAFEAMEILALDPEIYHAPVPQLYAPFLLESKAAIAALGNELEVPWSDTWSCYKGGELHCGRCGTCVERIYSFNHSGVSDPTQYADRDFAIRVLKEKGEWTEREAPQEVAPPTGEPGEAPGTYSTPVQGSPVQGDTPV